MKECTILFSSAEVARSHQRCNVGSLKPHVAGLGTLDCIDDSSMNGVIAAAEFLGNLVPHRLHERMGAITLALKQNRRLPYPWSALKRRAMHDVFAFLDHGAIRHSSSAVSFEES